jgi:hypothetical protein
VVSSGGEEGVLSWPNLEPPLAAPTSRERPRRDGCAARRPGRAFRPRRLAVGHVRCRLPGSRDPGELRSPSRGPFRSRPAGSKQSSGRPTRSRCRARGVSPRGSDPVSPRTSARSKPGRDERIRRRGEPLPGLVGSTGKASPVRAIEETRIPSGESSRRSDRRARYRNGFRVPPRPGASFVAAVPRRTRPTTTFEMGRERCSRRWSHSCGRWLGSRRRDRTPSPRRTWSVADPRDRRAVAGCEPTVPPPWQGTVFPPARLAAGEATMSASTRGGSGFRSSRRATRFGRAAVSDGVAMHSARAAHPHLRGAAPIRCSARKPAPRVEGAGVAEPYRGPRPGLGPSVESGSGAFAALCPGAPEDEPIGPARVDDRGEERPARTRPPVCAAAPAGLCTDSRSAEIGACRPPRRRGPQGGRTRSRDRTRFRRVGRKTCPRRPLRERRPGEPPGVSQPRSSSSSSSTRSPRSAGGSTGRWRAM